MKKLSALSLFMTACVLAQAAVMDKSGIYAVSDPQEVKEGLSYTLSGVLNYVGTAGAEVNVYVVASSSSIGDDIQTGLAQSDVRLIAAFNVKFDQAGNYQLSEALDFGGGELPSALIVLEALLPEDASLMAEDMALISVSDAAAGTEPGSGAQNAQDGAGGASQPNSGGAAGSSPSSSSASADASASSEGATEIPQMSLMASGGLVIYVNSASGDDANSGESAVSAKKTIASALGQSGVTQLNLAGGSVPYIAPLIKAPSGTVLVIKPVGSVIIKGQ